MNLEPNTILSGLLSGLIGALAMYLIAKKVSKTIVSQLIEEHFDLKTLQNDEELQKFIYSIGGLIGKGARKGVGMDRKLNPKDVVLNMAMDWWQDRRRGTNQGERPQTRQVDEDPLRIQ